METDFEKTSRQLFAQYIISKTLTAYLTDETFRNAVDEIANDTTVIGINGREWDKTEKLSFMLQMSSRDVAEQLTEAYYSEEEGIESEE